MSNVEENDDAAAPRSDYCDRKARFWTKKAARKSARTAGELFGAALIFYPCRKHGCFHLATSRRRRARPPPDSERPLAAPTKEQEEAARMGSRAIVRLIDARKSRKSGDMSIQMIPVKSSNVRAIGYDAGKGLRSDGGGTVPRILVQFANGVYECVRSDGSEASAAMTFERFLAAESKGKFYTEYIRRAVGVWNVRKLEQTMQALRSDGTVREDVAGYEQAIEESKAVKEMMERMPNASKEEIANAIVSEEQARHQFIYDMTSAGQGEDSCLECGLTPKHPVHLSTLELTESTRTEQVFPDAKAYAGTRTLILTVGLPRSGKTRWACATGFPIVSPDSIRLALHGRAFEPLAEPFVWAQARLMVRALFLAGHETVVLDACSVTRARRDEWRGSEWETFCVMFECSRGEAMCRVFDGIPENTADSESGRLLDAIERMSKNFEPLGEDERVWTGAPLLFNVDELKGIPTYPLSEGREVIPRSPYAGYNLPILGLDYKMPDPDEESSGGGKEGAE